MMQDDAFYAIGMFAIAAWLFKMWLGDLREFRLTGKPRKGEFPGARPASKWLIGLGVFLGLILLTNITMEEIVAGEVEAQTKVSFLAVFSWIGAAFVEELIFRGYLIVDNRGQFALWSSAIFFSLLFMIFHPFFWDYTIPEGGSIFDASFTFDFTTKAVRDSANVFASSIIFYALRFCPQNKMRSLIPCIAAHLSYNLGVFFVKAGQGFVVWSF